MWTVFVASSAVQEQKHRLGMSERSMFTWQQMYYDKEHCVHEYPISMTVYIVV